MIKSCTKRGFIALLFSLFSFRAKTNENIIGGVPYRDRFQSFRQTFRVEPDIKEAKKIVKNIIKGREYKKDLVNLSVPDIAEDGNVVPVSFKVNCTMEKEDYPSAVHILAMENAFPEIAIYNFTPECGQAEVSFRCRMRSSADIVVIAEMYDGTVGMTKKYVEVMLGACS